MKKTAPSGALPQLEISHTALERLFTAWNIPLPKEDWVLLGLRGALPLTVSRGLKSKAVLALRPPDYLHMRCTLGIWHRSGRQVFMAPGSTVPHLSQVEKAIALKGRGANQLEPGYYRDLRKGEHLQGKPRGHAALRQTENRFYRRSLHKPPYREEDRLFFGNPYDNLHCAWNPAPEKEGFSSAGCLVVSGIPQCPRLPEYDENQGPWKFFHDLLYRSPQKKFPLLLLPAEAARQALTQAVAKERLCYGSEGEAVKSLQRRLRGDGIYRGPINGKMDSRTYRAWEKAKQAEKKPK